MARDLYYIIDCMRNFLLILLLILTSSFPHHQPSHFNFLTDKNQEMQSSLFFIAFMALIMSTVAFLPTRVNGVKVQSNMELNARHGMKNWRSVTAGRIKAERVKGDKERWEESKRKWEEMKKPSEPAV